ncbi:hypothetical protein IWQ61_007126 [Dispira simplex]|nr:hypothetical protein IWQ61_007126 [Dispira simplex]
MADSKRTPTPADETSKFWNGRWKSGDIGWDIGQPAPPLASLLDTWLIQRLLCIKPATASRSGSIYASSQNAPSNLGAGNLPNLVPGEPGSLSVQRCYHHASPLTIDNEPLKAAGACDQEEIPSPPTPGKGKYKYALVPGCGSGYDVVLLAQYGWHAKGIDLSPIAINRARLIASDNPHEEHIVFQVENFFETKAPQCGYQLIFDYA